MDRCGVGGCRRRGVREHPEDLRQGFPTLLQVVLGGSCCSSDLAVAGADESEREQEEDELGHGEWSEMGRIGGSLVDASLSI
jgi:hypothetical protein